ncbi:MAG: hypothetical protein WCX30_03515 [Candidatus Paceibacterota bacterium]|jgi:hypothetical protein|nr:hypothetical protein [bacterium]
MNFLVGVTTTEGSDWTKKIKEINELHIKEVAVFPTCLDKNQRGELYVALEKSCIEKIPFVHLRSDMDVSEIEFFIKKFNTVIFNCHASRINPQNPSWKQYKEIICVENHGGFVEDELAQFGGICLDFTHMEDEIITGRTTQEEYQSILNKFPIKCNHISAIKSKFMIEDHDISFGSHLLEDLSELDYLKKYPLSYFSNYCAIELENSLGRQLEVIEHIKEILSNRDELIKKIF